MLLEYSLLGYSTVFLGKYLRLRFGFRMDSLVFVERFITLRTIRGLRYLRSLLGALRRWGRALIPMLFLF